MHLKYNFLDKMKKSIKCVRTLKVDTFESMVHIEMDISLEDMQDMINLFSDK